MYMFNGQVHVCVHLSLYMGHSTSNHREVHIFLFFVVLYRCTVYIYKYMFTCTTCTCISKVVKVQCKSQSFLGTVSWTDLRTCIILI